MKKLLIAGLVVITGLGGGYFFLSKSAQSAAEAAVTAIEKEMEAGVPNSDFTFGDVKADMFANTATVSNVALKIDGISILTADTVVVAGDETTLKRAELTGVAGS
mgnify:FL=1